jgi:nucleoside-diphosphate-sugar epimerase
VTILRPGPLVDAREFQPPGKLGRRIGDLFIAVCGRRETLGVVDVADAARTAVWAARNPDQAPAVLNVIDPNLPTKADLVARLRNANPSLRVVWLPRVFLAPLSWLAMGAQAILRPGHRTVNVSKVFLRRSYDIARMREVLAAMEGPSRTPVPSASEQPPAPVGPR